MLTLRTLLRYLYMNLSLSRLAPYALALFIPSITLASPQVPVDGLGLYLLQIIYFIDRYLVPVIFAIAFIVFLWGVYRYLILGAASEEKRQEGQKFIMYGLIGFFLMISVWGIVNLLINSFGFRSDQRPDLPSFGSPVSGGTGGSQSDPLQGLC